MCGRYAVTADPALLAVEIDAVDETYAPGAGPELVGRETPGFNAVPTQTVPVVLTRHAREDPLGEARRRLRGMRWGLLPQWRQSPSGPPLLNARSESVTDKPSFRGALKTKRCLIPMDGWYEWQITDRLDAKGKPRKQPVFMTPADGTRLYVAGLWAAWRAPGTDSPVVLSMTILTCASVGELVRVHERMPLVLTPGAFDAWLDPDGPPPPGLLRPPAPALAAGIEIRPVSALVNSNRNDGPDLVRRVDPDGEDGQLSLL